MKKIFLMSLFLIAFAQAASAANIIVSNNGADVLDAGDDICSLREAIINANADAVEYDDCPMGTGDDTIILQNGVTYVLSITGSDTLPSDAGDLDVLDTDALAITTLDLEGAPAVIDASDMTTLGISDRIFDVNGPSIFSLNNVVLQNGRLDDLSESNWLGGCIRALNVTSLTIENSSLLSCQIDTTTTETTKGGAIYLSGGAVGLHLSNVTITNALVQRANEVSDAVASGAAIYFFSDDGSSEFDISNSTISTNATSNAFGLAEAAVTVVMNAGGVDANIDNSTFDGNDATSLNDSVRGGALNLIGLNNFLITNSTISNSNISAATQASGAGLYFDNLNDVGGQITNSTFTGNIASGATLSSGGGIAGVSATASLYLSFVTIADNSAGAAVPPTTAAQGGGINIITPTYMINSLLVDNTVNGVSTNGADCNSVSINSLGNNLLSDPSDCSTLVETDITLVSNGLNDLADNGGVSFTQDFTAGYEAVDAASADCMNAYGDLVIDTDQRGAPRTVGSCDIGAYELGTFYTDADEDGFAGTSSSYFYDNAFVIVDDCNDAESEINPDATEMCDGVDNNCDDEIDESTAADASTWYHDVDGDGFGDVTDSQPACTQPANFVADDTDCNDNSDVANPEVTEVCDEIDNDCDAEIDESSASDATTWYHDVDGDGFGDETDSQVACTQPSDYVADDTDCNDDSDDINTSASELCDDIDNNCDGNTDEDFDVGDSCSSGVGACAATGTLECNSDGTATECNAATTESSDELCGDEIDNDCDGETDEGFETAGDACSTGVGACEATGVFTCTDDGLSLECDAVASDAVDEVCDDLIDNDCDGDVDADDSDCDSSGGGGCELNPNSHDISAEWLFVAAFGVFRLGMSLRRRLQVKQMVLVSSHANVPPHIFEGFALSQNAMPLVSCASKMQGDCCTQTHLAQAPHFVLIRSHKQLG